ncbi:MAG: response regulator [Desulfobulbaceae bacterium]|nr:response regulator [Desulfobulbaceae bacterium]HIJ89986.1 response regulator [Deltaproteobacteria bacterium]
MARILLIDDEQMVLELLVSVLTRAGYEVITAGDGLVACQLCRSQDFDLVITDIIMPEMDGIEMIQELRQRCPQVKIIAMSGGGRCSPQDYLEIAGVLGVSATIAKPFSNKDFLATVNEVLSH